MIVLATAQAAPELPVSQSVGVLYNSSSTDSTALANAYAKARQIPATNLIGLPLPDKEEITREEFNKALLEPLKAEYDKRGWWKREKDPAGNLIPTTTRIRILTCMFGVPSRIAATASEPKAKPGGQPVINTSEAAVDSELALLGLEGLPIAGPLKNPYFKMEKSFSESGLPMTLVGRIDGPSRAVCERMIRDAAEAEKTGLWGMAVIDIAKKFPDSAAGDPSLENIVKLHGETGIPTLVDRFPDTLPINYPLRDVALYYGWYDWHVSGPFLNGPFRFKKGAVAVHLHSFSASQLRDPGKNWSAPLLARGAAATLGNVYEPYLEMTHHFDIFQTQLLAGYTLVEAAYMSVPVLSWQNVVLGDPLYRPFLHLDGSGERSEGDRDYRAIRVATLRWKDDPKELDAMLRDAADRMKSGVMIESLAMKEVEQQKGDEAASDFQKAKIYYTEKTDRLRMDLQVAAVDRAAGRNAAAIKTLRGARMIYSTLPEGAAAQSWLNILDPPAPPATPPR
ncbi:TIGR03790 family protein [Luteolibacter sp. Populi]|uniref:TIGR03790 family protein n=1 Tax=Luteolibacter sp. Populi TaxID=3230487 RepID=UPI00346567F0